MSSSFADCIRSRGSTRPQALHVRPLSDQRQPHQWRRVVPASGVHDPFTQPRPLPLIEWGFIFAPLLFHGIVGVWIWRTGQSNLSHYRLSGNRRYTWQRWTGLIAFAFLMAHVFHLHGWFHFAWLAIAQPLGGANFSPYNAGSTLIAAMNGMFWPAFYLVGMLACVYHLANGLWTAGITWGLWISESAQKQTSQLCGVFGVALAVIGMTAWVAAVLPGTAAVEGAYRRRPYVRSQRRSWNCLP